MSAFVVDWLNLLLRWAHMIAGIGWIGTSFYFIALDLSLKKRERMKEGVLGTAWQVHGGGFYHVEKFTVAPKELPGDLIWFKWEAYLTWFTGFLLLVVQFYLDAGAWMIDPAVLDLEPLHAVGISVASLAVGWFVYDGLCRSPIGRRPTLLAGAAFLWILLAAYIYTNVFSGRAAMIHVGAFIGTLMAANVFAAIIPNQKRITRALLAGRAPDPKLGAIGQAALGPQHLSDAAGARDHGGRALPDAVGASAGLADRRLRHRRRRLPAPRPGQPRDRRPLRRICLDPARHPGRPLRGRVDDLAPATGDAGARSLGRGGHDHRRQALRVLPRRESEP